MRYMNTAQGFPKCGTRIPKEPRPFPGGSCSHFCNGYFAI